MPQHISHGADVEQLDDIAVRLWRQGERIGDVGERGSRLLETLRVTWEGPDFEDFVSKWRAAHRGIDAAQGAVRAHSRALLEESDAQRRTSGLSSGQGGSHAGGGGGGAAFERVVPARHEEATWDWAGRRDDLDRPLPGRPEPHPPVAGPPFASLMVPVLPTLTGAEDVPLAAAEGPALERSLPWAAEQVPATAGELEGATAQVPTGEGVHLTTTTGAAGETSVAFDPVITELSGE